MKKNRILIISISILVLFTVCLAILHSVTREPVTPGTIQIVCGDQTMEISLDSIERSAVHGSVVDGKGEEHTVDADGVLLADFLENVGITAVSQVTVFADDEYSATVSADELYEEDRVYLLLRDGDRPQIIVFRDSNSKRNVRSVVRLVVS